jgi:outer membrane protein OmpA-like peptidoglycan-associated protein
VNDSASTATTIRFKNVYYETGSAGLESDSYFELDHMAGLLNKYSNVKVEVSGHTDNVGDSAANRELSRQRAQSVVNRLVQKGISADRMVVVGYGDSRPAETNDTEEGRATNRRTELRVISKS